MQKTARDLQLHTRNVVMNELLDPAKNITSVNQMSSEVRAAYDGAPGALQGIFNDRMRKNASMDVPPTNAGAKRFSELQGLATSDPEAYQDINIDNEKLLTRGQKITLSKAQVDHAELVKRGAAVDSAMKSIHPFLNDAGIADSAKDEDKRKQYIQFRGAFEAALNAEMADKKRKLYPKEITDIGQSLLKETVTDPGYPFIPFTGETKRGYQFELRPGKEAEDYAKIPSGSIYKIGAEYRKKS
jgi:hypothetical protein